MHYLDCVIFGLQNVPIKANPESEQDIQNEIKGWVINKGLGETLLHRAARLGYTVSGIVFCILFI